MALVPGAVTSKLKIPCSSSVSMQQGWEGVDVLKVRTIFQHAIKYDLLDFLKRARHNSPPANM